MERQYRIIDHKNGYECIAITWAKSKAQALKDIKELNPELEMFWLTAEKY